MELTMRSLSFASFSTVTRDCKPKVLNPSNRSFDSALHLKSLEQGRRKSVVSSALAETAVSVVIAATVVGAAATYLVKTTKAEAAKMESSLKTCEACAGSGICPECKGEGFVVKRLSDENAERARLTAKNMATRYTAGLPKKWSYCTKCSSSRSCNACGGRGLL